MNGGVGGEGILQGSSSHVVKIVMMHKQSLLADMGAFFKKKCLMEIDSLGTTSAIFYHFLKLLY